MSMDKVEAEEITAVLEEGTVAEVQVREKLHSQIPSLFLECLKMPGKMISKGTLDRLE